MNNVQEMIAAFQAWKDEGDFSEQVNNDLLRYFLDRSVLPTFQTRKWDTMGKLKHVNNREIGYSDLKGKPETDEELAEYREVQNLLDRDTLWDSYEDLMALVTKYPPVLLEQSLIIGMVIYMMRSEDADFDIDTEEWTEFYQGWSSVVCQYNV